MAQRGDPSIPSSVVEEIKQFVSVTLTVAAAGNYTAGDILGNDADDTEGDALEVAVGGRGEIVNVRQIVAVCSEDSVLQRVRLHFFNYNPAAADVELDDNAAYGISNATGAAGFVGSILLQPFVDRGAVAISETDLIDKVLACASGSGSLYVVVENVDAETNETAGMTVRFDFYLS